MFGCLCQIRKFRIFLKLPKPLWPTPFAQRAPCVVTGCCYAQNTRLFAHQESRRVLMQSAQYLSQPPFAMVLIFALIFVRLVRAQCDCISTSGARGPFEASLNCCLGTVASHRCRRCTPQRLATAAYAEDNSFAPRTRLMRSEGWFALF